MPASRRLALGSAYGCALGSAAQVVCWGTPDPDQGAASPPAGIFQHLSAKVSTTCGVAADASLRCFGSTDGGARVPPAGSFLQMDVGIGASCGVKSDRSLTCWGDSSIPALPAGSCVEVGVGRHFACGIDVAGRLQCAGSLNGNAVQAPSGTFTTLASCALRADGSVGCWGSNSNGRSTPPVGPL